MIEGANMVEVAKAKKEKARKEEERILEAAKVDNIDKGTLCCLYNLGKSKDKKTSPFGFDVMFGTGRSSLEDFLFLVDACGGRIVYDGKDV